MQGLLGRWNGLLLHRPALKYLPTTALAKGFANDGGAGRIKSSFSPTLPPQVLINCLRNNIFITVSTIPGHQLFKISAGTAGFSGGQKTSPKAALAMLDTLRDRLTQLNISQIRLNFRGLNSARPIIVGQLRRMGLQVTEIIDTTGIPFNGCRPPKARRL